MDQNNIFLDISIIKTLETELSFKEILEIIKVRVEKTKELSCTWIGTDANPVLRLIFSSKDKYLRYSTRGFEFLDVLINNLTKEQITKMFTNKYEEDIQDETKIYLVLKYKCLYKDPLRAKYKYNKWFEENFRCQIFIEEVEDGFLHFYKRKSDFTNANLDVTIPEDLKQWIKNKNMKVPQELIDHIYSFLK
ncbi:hypothetical protein [Candidatus Lokiarchaeum ossiferum]|uniref:hypothetical protein n=1 Tax=Candidatus Lokiarchaeum ossiferum TaxID=2951803 RepID=UPI00352CDC6B